MSKYNALPYMSVYVYHHDNLIQFILFTLQLVSIIMRIEGICCYFTKNIKGSPFAILVFINYCYKTWFSCDYIVIITQNQILKLSGSFYRVSFTNKIRAIPPILLSNFGPFWDKWQRVKSSKMNWIAANFSSSTSICKQNRQLVFFWQKKLFSYKKLNKKCRIMFIS